VIKDTPDTGQVKVEDLESLAAHWGAILESEGMPAELLLASEQLVEEQGEDLEDGEDFAPRKRVENVGTTDEYFEGEPEDDGAREGEPQRPRLTPGDEQVLARLRECGWAATPQEAGVHSDEQLSRLADANAAYLMAGGPDGRCTVVAMAGATRGDVERAANRAAAELLEELFEETVAETRLAAAEISRRLERLGGAACEEELYGSLLGRFHCGTVSALLRVLVENGTVRRVRSRATGARLVALADASRETLAGAAKTVARCARQSARNVRISGKTFARGASGSRPEDRSPAEVEREIARGWAEFLAARARALSTPLPKEHLRWTDTGLVCSFDGALRGARRAARSETAPLAAARAERAAWDTARAIRVSRMPSATHRMLYRLRCAGEWVALSELGAHYAKALADECGLADRRGALREALSELREAGRVRVARNRKDGRLYAAALRPIEHRREEGALLSIIADPENGIPISEGSLLARRVAGVRRAIERRDASQGSAGRAEIEPAA
jgi:DNA-binding MarR family transcriptional regulator